MATIPKNVVLVSTPRTVSPRSPILSDKYNSTIKENNKDLANLTIQLNAITSAAKRLHADAWETVPESGQVNPHGIDAYTTYWDARPASGKQTISDYVTLRVSELETKINELDAGKIAYSTNNIIDPNILSLNNEDKDVQHTLDYIVNLLPALGGGGILSVNLTNVTINENLTPDGTSYTLGTIASPWSHGYFENLTVATMTTLNSNTVTTADKDIVLNSGATQASDANGGGILLKTGPGANENKSIIYDQPNDKWEINAGLNVSSLTVNGSAISGSSTAANVTYANPGGLANLSNGINNAQDAITALAQIPFSRAKDPIKRVPTAGLIMDPTNAGMTAGQWLEALFFPFLPGTMQSNFLNYFMAEAGQSISDFQVRTTVTIDAADTIISAYIKLGNLGFDANDATQYTVQPITINVPTSSEDPKVFFTDKTVGGTALESDKSVRTYIVYNNEGTSQTQESSLDLIFHQRSSHHLYNDAATPTAENIRDFGTGLFGLSSAPPSTLPVIPNQEHVYLCIPVKFGKYLTAIGDPNVDGITGVLGAWEIVTALPGTTGGTATVTDTLDSNFNVIKPTSSQYQQLYGVADPTAQYDYIVYRTKAELDSSGATVMYNFIYGNLS